MLDNSILQFKDFINQYIKDPQININKLYEELLSFFSETEKEFISRRHTELKNEGNRNSDIYKLIIYEVNNHLFKGSLLTERQIKRIIYKE
jgi:hypothetical protein